MAAVSTRMSRARSLLSPVAPKPLAVANSAAEELGQDDFEYDHTPTDTQDYSFEGAYDSAQELDDEYICDAATTVSPSSRPPPAMQSGPVPRMPHEVSNTAVLAFDPLFGLPEARPSAMESGPFWSHVAGHVPPGIWREQAPANNPNVTSTVLVRVRPNRWLLTTAVASCVAMLTAFGVVYAFAMARGAAEVGTANIISATASQTGATHLPAAPTAPPVVQAPVAAPDPDPPAAAAPTPAPTTKHTHRAKIAVATPSPAPAPAPTTKTKRAAAPPAPAPQEEDLSGSSNSTHGDAKAILDSAL